MTEGANGAIVKINMATYLPRFLVGAISEVAANAVSSLTPAPAPAIAMPPVYCTQSDIELYLCYGCLGRTDENVHGFRRGAYDHPDDDKRSTNDGDISTAD